MLVIKFFDHSVQNHEKNDLFDRLVQESLKTLDSLFLTTLCVPLPLSLKLSFYLFIIHFGDFKVYFNVVKNLC